METITGANGVRPLEGALICKSRDDLVRYRTSLAQPPALRQILRARRGRLQPGLMRRSGATQADTSATILEPALVGATRPPGAGALSVVSDRGAFLRSHRVSGVELPVALFDAASPLVPGNGGTDMVRASAFACCGDFRLRSAGCK